MSARTTLATAARVLRQLRSDHRTIALLLVVPTLLMVLLRYVFDGSPVTFNSIGLPLLAIFPFVTMFLVTSVAMLRERTSGTLERLLTTPMGKLDLLMGYALAFAVATLLQVGVASAVAFTWLNLEAPGGVAPVVLIALADALLGMSLGLLVSAFAATEFQAVQFLPAIVLPQFLLCGLLAPRDQMLDLLRWISDVLPLSYAVDGMTRLRTEGSFTGQVGTDLAVVVACTVVALALGAATLRRRTA
ncbi:MAG: antibiotic ABC transporter permease [Pseudonocardiales bacterium]|nr:MAG: antibiotic ABC transporter permease [Pseudonocardiales bacterium]